MTSSDVKTQFLRVISVFVVIFLMPCERDATYLQYIPTACFAHILKDPHGVVGAEVPGVHLLSGVVSSDQDERQIERPKVLADLLEGRTD